MRKIIMIKVILEIFGVAHSLKIPGNSWKELRGLEGEGILRTFA